MYQVFAFYPNINLKVRVTEYKTKAEAYEYISGLRMCETPYAAWKNWKNMFDIETYDLTREIMAEMVQKYL